MEKRILIAIDKFKGSLTSLEAAQAIKRGIRNGVEMRQCEQALQQELVFDIVPIADGGDGSAEVIKYVIPGVEEIQTTAVNPLGKEIGTSYLLYWGSAGALMSPCYNYSSKAAFIEMAKVSGLALIDEQERNPLITTTYGLGQLVKDAYLRGAREITLSIGGSATNDGGTGMLQALGFKFYNKAGELITDYMCGGLLGEIGRIETPERDELRRIKVEDNEYDLLGLLKECKINVVCDVTNPLLGSNGATYVYGPQKGATVGHLKILERGMENYVEVAGRGLLIENKDVHMESVGVFDGEVLGGAVSKMHLVPGAGAAGGVGYAVIRFLNGNLVNGWKFFASITDLKERIAQADVVISGEGKIDSQSFSGKVIDGIFTMVQECNKNAMAENRANKEVLLFCGINELSASDYKVYALKDIEPDTQKCMHNAAALLEQLVQQSIELK